MSRGLGTLQKRIIAELERTPTKRLPWAELERRFPNEAAQRGLHRAVRALRGRGIVFDHYVGGRRHVALTVLGDTELLALCEAAHAQLKAVCRGRGVPVPPLGKPVSPEPEWDSSERGLDD